MSKDILKKLKEFMGTQSSLVQPSYQKQGPGSVKGDHVGDFIGGLSADESNDDGDTRYDYPRAGKNAPKEVQEAIKKFLDLPKQERENIPLLYWLLGDSTPSYKMTKLDSKYTDESKEEDEKCENCKFFYQKHINGKFICSQISGRISPHGKCKFWKR